MTEVSGVSCANSVYRPEDVGTVGGPVEGLELKLSAEKEIYIRGEAIFKSYYRNAVTTNESFDDGWFKTGDMGEVTPTGAVKIIGRLKEQFKSAKGKYVSPVPIESKLSACHLVEQVFVVGSGMPQPLALLVLAEGLELGKEALTAKLEQLLTDVNSRLESHETLDGLLSSMRIGR
jgi:long-chain acyl-CoA synthetase